MRHIKGELTSSEKYILIKKGKNFPKLVNFQTAFGSFPYF